MIKHGKVVPGETPSIVSGRPSEKIEGGEPVREGEKPVDAGLKKLSSVIEINERPSQSTTPVS